MNRRCSRRSKARRFRGHPAAEAAAGDRYRGPRLPSARSRPAAPESLLAPRGSRPPPRPYGAGPVHQPRSGHAEHPRDRVPARQARLSRRRPFPGPRNPAAGRNAGAPRALCRLRPLAHRPPRGTEREAPRSGPGGRCGRLEHFAPLLALPADKNIRHLDRRRGGNLRRRRRRRTRPISGVFASHAVLYLSERYRAAVVATARGLHRPAASSVRRRLRRDPEGLRRLDATPSVLLPGRFPGIPEPLGRADASTASDQSRRDLVITFSAIGHLGALGNQMFQYAPARRFGEDRAALRVRPGSGRPLARFSPDSGPPSF